MVDDPDGSYSILTTSMMGSSTSSWYRCPGQLIHRWVVLLSKKWILNNTQKLRQIVPVNAETMLSSYIFQLKFKKKKNWIGFYHSLWWLDGLEPSALRLNGNCLNYYLFQFIWIFLYWSSKLLIIEQKIFKKSSGKSDI